RYSLEIAPADASRNSVIYVIPRGFRLSDAEIQWLLNGMVAASPTASRFNASDTNKGDNIQARAVIKGTEILSNVVQIKNTPPEITRYKILPVVFNPDDTLSVEVEANDVDGDEVTILYEWTKNGEPAGNGRQIEGGIKRGDKISIRMMPFDGLDYGQPVIRKSEIANVPPMIVGGKEFDFDGKIYIYQVRAADHDGDTLAFSLKSAPEGMSINSSTGVISWDVPSEFTGKVPITVSVTDGNGGESVQDLTLTINPPQ
ncbi:MAG: Ig domain-containing protein, partial [Thermodesulfovibrionia bacterium]